MNFKVNESATKLRGGYYTKPEIASFLLRWAVASDGTALLEPSCGDGVFFRQLASDTDVRQRVGSVRGFELDTDEAAKAAAACSTLAPIDATVESKDFLGWALRNLMAPPRFDAVVGNPPFIRYQYCEPDFQAMSEEIFRRFRLRFTKHTNAWVPFVIASIALLRPGGRLAMVVPAEILHVLHAQSLRTYLAGQCSHLRVIDPQEIWFEDTLQGAVLLMAEKKATPQSHSHGVAIMATKGDAFLHESPNRLFSDADFANGDTIRGKWTHALLSAKERALLRDLEAGGIASRFGTLAEADVGLVTGANKFFLIPDAIVESHGLQPWAHPMFGRSEHVQGVIYDEGQHNRNRAAGLPTNFLWFTDERLDDLPESVRKYIVAGQKEKLHTRYKCRIRDPWYAVPSVYHTEVGMLKRSHDFPRLIHNRAKALTTDTAYRISPVPGVGAPQLVFSFVNSLTALSAELEGRHYGGGVLELVPSEIERLLVPLVDHEPGDIEALDSRVASQSGNDEVLRNNDEIVLRRAGLSTQQIRVLQRAWDRLRSRRQRRD